VKVGIKTKAIWITWENQRRTNELSKALDVPLYKYLSDRYYLIRLLVLSARTCARLFIARPHMLIVQNPSIVLATVACLLRRIVGYTLVVDRHSNFRLERMHLRSLKEMVFQMLSRYTVKKAHLTIVTNEFLKNVLEDWGGRGFVLPDKLPQLPLAEKVQLTGKNNIVFVCSYSGDEPVTEVIEAARLCDPSTVIHITGDNRKLEKDVLDSAPPNVRFTGFLNEKDYQSILLSCDAVMVLTTAEHFLLCGAYEAVSLDQPLILSDKETLRNYFNKGVVFAKNDAKNISKAIRTAIREKECRQKEIGKLASDLPESWQRQFDRLQEQMDSL